MEENKSGQEELTEEILAAPESDSGETAPVEDKKDTAAAPEKEISSEEIPAEDDEKSAEAADRSSGEEKKDNAPEEKKATPGMIAGAVAVVVLLAAVLVALILAAVNEKNPEDLPAETTGQTVSSQLEVPTEATIPPDGNPEDVTARGTYTVSDEEVIAAADTVVATMGDLELTNAQLQVYYWMEVQSFLNNYGGYISYFGLDPQQSLDTQVCTMVDTGTWQQFFLKSALESWQNYQSMAAEADAMGHKMDEDGIKFIEEMPAQMEEQALANGFADGKAMLAYNVGAGAEIEDYVHFMRLYHRGYSYFVDTCAEFAPTEEEISQYFADHEQELADQGITKDTVEVDVRHILIAPQLEEGQTDASQASEEAWIAAEQKAQEILDAFLAGEQTGENFGVLAAEHTEDPGSKANGGLYEHVMQGQMVPEFDQWCFDAARQVGDTGIVKTQFGYHIMFFAGSRSVWQQHAESGKLDEMAAMFIEEVTGKYPMEVDYPSVKLGYVDLAADLPQE